MLETHCSNDVRIAVGILDPLEAVSGADTPLATLAFMWQRPPSAEVVYGRSLTAAAAAMISLDGGLRACTGPREGRKGEERRAVSGLGRILELCSHIFQDRVGSQCGRNSTAI